MLALALFAAGAVVSISKLVGDDSASARPAPQTLKKAVYGLTEHNGRSMFPI